ncbi:hypothetical protein BDC45DRAFT_184504 [Circinella umbellata]|nr:hypothetical protein BDC45DRAFT_184504 [Circinella umbellata]
MSTENQVALTAELIQSHKNLLAKYFNCTENPTLEHFVSTHVSQIIHPKDLNIKQYWSGQYKTATKNAKKPFVQGEPDWYDAHFQSIQKQIGTNTLSTPIQTSNTSSTSYKFLQQMLETHSKMKHKKWTLPSGVIVEDKMVDYCRQLDYEHAGHSFILDINDDCWETVFESEDLQYIKSYKLPSFVVQEDEEVLSYIRSFDGKV